MTPYLTEEAVESAEAIAARNPDAIAEELGDLLFLSVFCLELLAEKHGIGLADAMERAADKLIRRHPHVYGSSVISDGDAAYRQWQEIKRREKGGNGSLLGELPRGLPALVAAYRLQEKAGAVGFDWPNADGAFVKIREELEELETARGADTTPEVAREVGDLLFAVVNGARHLRVDPERELRVATHRFRDRFHHVERRLSENGRTPSQATLEEMDALWEEAKRLSAANPSPEQP
jgi:tetrapyrrole methylase family protein/MazG family protein/ATP diphosphatase